MKNLTQYITHWKHLSPKTSCGKMTKFKNLMRFSKPHEFLLLCLISSWDFEKKPHEVLVLCLISSWGFQFLMRFFSQNLMRNWNHHENSHEVFPKSHEDLMRTSWGPHVVLMRSSWGSHEVLMRFSWGPHEVLMWFSWGLMRTSWGGFVRDDLHLS